MKMSKLQANGTKAMQLLQTEIDTRGAEASTWKKDTSLTHSDVMNALRRLEKARAIQSSVSATAQSRKSNQATTNPHARAPDQEAEDVEVLASISPPNRNRRETEDPDYEEEEDIYNATPEATLHLDPQTPMHSKYTTGIVSGRTCSTSEKRNQSVLRSGGDKRRRMGEL
jgi:hypothetical protein